MTPLVTISNRQRGQRVDLRLLRRIAQTLLAELLQIESADLGICLVAASEMTQLNETFLRHQGPTDVVTFDYTDHAGRRSRPAVSKRKKNGNRQDACAMVHGEIFICLDEAFLQARRFRTSWQSEIVRYLTHGVLHLVGHDDSGNRERRKMKREESRLLRELSRRFSLAQLARADKLSRCKNH